MRSKLNLVEPWLQNLVGKSVVCSVMAPHLLSAVLHLVSEAFG